MEWKTEELFREFYKENKNTEEFKGISFDHCVVILKSPFKLLAKSITGEENISFRLKYFGKFYINPVRLKYLKRDLVKRLEENKINIVHYTSVGSKYDSETHWGFTHESIDDLVKFFNAFNHGIELTSEDLNFLDENYDSYKHQHDNPKHLYNDDSDLIKFGNSYEESFAEKEDIFLIINNSKSPLFKYFPKVARYLRVRDIPYKAACSPEEVLRYNQEYNIIGAFSTGSDYSMKAPDSKTEFATSEEALRTLKCPILAMCYGFQSMSKFYGQNVDGGELNSGLFNLTDFDSEHFLFKNIDLTEQKVNFCFHDYPTNVPVDFENIAMLGETIAGISNKNLKRYGILFHPEELEETCIILDNFVNECKISTPTKLLKLQTFENFIKKSL